MFDEIKAILLQLQSDHPFLLGDLDEAAIAVMAARLQAQLQAHYLKVIPFKRSASA